MKRYFRILIVAVGALFLSSLMVCAKDIKRKPGATVSMNDKSRKELLSAGVKQKQGYYAVSFVTEYSPKQLEKVGKEKGHNDGIRNGEMALLETSDVFYLWWSQNSERISGSDKKSFRDVLYYLPANDLGELLPESPAGHITVRKAQAAGLTEQDPRLDLSGKDALRKLIILAREAGVQLEEEDVEIAPVVPQELFQGSVEQFYKGLEAYEPQFAKQARQAESQGFRRRFVAYKAGIGLKNVPPVHPAYHLRGTENAIIVRSAFHPYPLVIQGPGEGAREAASSILNDILR